MDIMSYLNIVLFFRLKSEHLFLIVYIFIPGIILLDHEKWKKKLKCASECNLLNSDGLQA